MGRFTMTHNERYRIQGGDRIMEREVLSQSDREGKHGSMRRTASSPRPQEVFTEPLRVHSVHLPGSGHQGTSSYLFCSIFERDYNSEFLYHFSHFFKGNLNHTHTHLHAYEQAIYICEAQRTI